MDKHDASVSFWHRKRWLIRLRYWEYWPLGVVYFPVIVYYLWLSLKARSMAFFTAVNPAIPAGGFAEDRKSDIYALLPEDLVPTTLYVGVAPSPEAILAEMKRAGMQFPVIAKPDMGERGFLVFKCKDNSDFTQLSGYPEVNWLIQAFAAHPLEVSVLYYRMPGEASGHISSLTLKHLLQVDGDGLSTVAQLVRRKPRAWLQWPILEKEHPEWNYLVPPMGETLELVPVGNHARGAEFICANEQITPELVLVFDSINQQMPGTFFGRFDVKCNSIETLSKGEDFAILEWNGAKAEPIHIYHPGFPLLRAYRDLFAHWHNIYRISMANQRAGTPFLTAMDMASRISRHVSYRKKVVAA